MKLYYVLLLLSSLLVVHAADPPNETPQSEKQAAATQQPQEKATPMCEKCTCKNETKTIDCSNKQMSVWFTDDELSQLNNTFEILLFNNNNFQEIKLFPNINIKQLILNHNNISKIANGAFKNLQQLVTLDLSHNNLTSQNLKPEAFEGRYSPDNYEPIPKLQELNLAYNDLHSLDQDLFEHFPALEKLILRNNSFTIIDNPTTIAIASIQNLKYLDLSYVQLTKIPETIFHAPRLFTHLNLKGNKFTKLPAALLHAINLEELYLDENPLEDFVDKNVFPKLLKLVKLNLTQIGTLKKIGKGAFSNLEGKFAYDILNNWLRLKELSLEGCFNLTEIHPDAFSRAGPDGRPDYPPVEKLNIRRNKLTSLDHDVLVRWDTIKIEMGENAWDCQCENEWLVHDLYPQLRVDNLESAKKINCSSPQALKDKPFEKIYQDKNVLRCPDKYGNRPENDGKLLMGLLVGLLIGIPIAMGVLLIYRRGCFGLFNSYRYEHSRALYKRASFNEDY